MQQHHGLADLFIETLRDIYSAEKQILRSLPKLARAADSETLREAFLTHRDQTEDQIERLDQVFELVGARPGRKTCEAMQGILEEGDETMADFAGSDALDAGLIAASQTVEHYEISRYTALRDWAQALGITRAATLLGETLDEEKETDRLLTEIAESAVNGGASGTSQEVSTASGAVALAAGRQSGSAKGAASGKGASAKPGAATPAGQGAKEGARSGAPNRGGAAAPAGANPQAGNQPAGSTLTPAPSAGAASIGSQKSPGTAGRTAGTEEGPTGTRTPSGTTNR